MKSLSLIGLSILLVGLGYAGYVSGTIGAPAASAQESVVDTTSIDYKVSELQKKADWLEAELNTLKAVDARMKRDLSPLTRAIRVDAGNNITVRGSLTVQ